MGGLYVPGMKIIMNLFPPSKSGAAVGIYTGSMVAAQGTSYIAGPVAAAYGWQAGVLATSVWGLPAAMIAWALLAPGPKNIADGASRPSPVFGLPAILITLSYMGHTWELYAMRGWIGAFLFAAGRQTGYGVSEAVALASWISIATVMIGAFSPWLGGWLSDRIGRTKAVILILWMSMPCSLVYGWLIGLPIWALAGIALFYGFWIMADTAIFKVGLAELVPSSSIGMALGVQSFLGFASSSLATALFGLVLDMTNDPKAVSALGYFPFWGWAFTMLGVGASVGPAAAYLLMRNPASIKMGGGKR